MTKTLRLSEIVDFAIVGSGAAGGVIARELSQAGFSVVVFEQGHTLADFQHDELKNWFSAGLINDVVKSPQTFRDDHAKRGERNLVRPNLYYARTVGGSTAHYTANYWRLHECDFDECSRLGPIAGTGFADWPIDYAELEPYYTKVEWEVGVSGLAGASPFDPWRSKPYPMSPLPVKSSGVLLERGARKLGLHPFPAPLAINSQPYRGRPACIHCGFCHGHGCEVGAKASTLTTMIPEAEATGRCEVRSESYVVQVVTDKNGRASGVRYFDSDQRERLQKARAVVVSANGAETPRLLLMSANSMFPQGLANSSGLVGKYLMWNFTTRTHATFEHELNEFKSVQCSRIVHDFYDSDPKRGFIRGGVVGEANSPTNQPLSFALVTYPGYPAKRAWGRELKDYLRKFPRTVALAAVLEDLPMEVNQIDLDPTVKDGHGLPAPRITHRQHPNDFAMNRWFTQRLMGFADAAGATDKEYYEQDGADHYFRPLAAGDVDPRDRLADACVLPWLRARFTA